MSKIPQIRIYVSPLLLEQGVGFSLDELRQKTVEYRHEWTRVENDVLTGLTNILGLDFYLNIIDVYVANGGHSISMPLIMRSNLTPSGFVDSLAHELCHNILCDNSVMSIKNPDNKYSLTDTWTKLFGEYPTITRNHIPVQALMKYIYLDVLKDESRFEQDIARSKGKHGYEDSWEYVNRGDYKKIIEDLRQSYEGMK